MPFSIFTDRVEGPFPELAAKAPVRVATTEPITAYGLQTIDGIAVSENDRVLRKDEEDQRLNGIWLASASTWRRAADADGRDDLTNGTTVLVQEGVISNGVTFKVTSERSPVIGSDNLTFSPTFTGQQIDDALVEIAELVEQAQDAANGLRLVKTISATTYTIVPADQNVLLRFISPFGCLVSLPEDLPVGFRCGWAQAGIGLIQFSTEDGASFYNRQGGTGSTGRGASGELVVDAPGSWLLTGDVDGGAPESPTIDLNFTGPVAPSGITFTRSGGAYYFDSTGTLVQQAASNVPVFPSTFDSISQQWRAQGMALREYATSGLANNTGAGAVVGTPGTLPTGWNKNQAGGMTWKVVSLASRNGIPGVTLELSGTRTGTAAFFCDILFAENNVFSTVAGDVLCASTYVEVVSGSLQDASLVLAITDYTAGGATVASSSSAFTPLSGVQASRQRVVARRSITSATVAYARSYIRVSYPVGTFEDVRSFQIFIGLPMLEKGVLQPSDPVPASGTVAVRNVERLALPIAIGAWDYIITANGLDTWVLNQNVAEDTGGGLVIPTRLPNGAHSLSRIRMWPRDALPLAFRRLLVPDALPIAPLLDLIADAGLTIEGPSELGAWDGDGPGRAVKVDDLTRPSKTTLGGLDLVRATPGEQMTLSGLTYSDDISFSVSAMPATSARMTLIGAEDTANVPQLEFNGQAPGTVSLILPSVFVMTSGAAQQDGRLINAVLTKTGYNYAIAGFNGESNVDFLTSPRPATFVDSPSAKRLFRRAVGSQPFDGYVRRIRIDSPALTQAQADRFILEMEQYRVPLKTSFSGLMTFGVTDSSFKVRADFSTDVPFRIIVATDIGFTAIAATTGVLHPTAYPLGDGVVAWSAFVTMPATSQQQYYVGVEIDGVLDITTAGKVKTYASQGVAAQHRIGLVSCIKMPPATVMVSAEKLATLNPDVTLLNGDIGYSNIKTADVTLYRKAARSPLFVNSSLRTLLLSGSALVNPDDHDYAYNDCDLPGAAALFPLYRQVWREMYPDYQLWDTADPPRSLSRSYTAGRTRVIVLDTRGQRITAGLDTTVLGNAVAPAGGFNAYQKLLDELAFYVPHADFDNVVIDSPTGLPAAIYGGWRDYAPAEFAAVQTFIRDIPNARARVSWTSGDIHSSIASDGTEMDFATGGGVITPLFLSSPFWNGNTLPGDKNTTWNGSPAYHEDNGRMFGDLLIRADGSIKYDVWGRSASASPITMLLLGSYDTNVFTGALSVPAGTLSQAAGSSVSIRVTRAGAPPIGGTTFTWQVKSGATVVLSGTVTITSTQRWRNVTFTMPVAGSYTFHCDVVTGGVAFSDKALTST